MKFKSFYYDRSFGSKHQKYRFSFGGSLGLACFAIIASNHYKGTIPEDLTYRGRILYKIIHGLKRMDTYDILIAVTASIVVGLITMFIVDRVFSNRPVVVGLESNETNKEISFKIRKKNGTKAKLQSYAAGSIAYRKKWFGDGLSRGKKYECLVFTKDFNTLAVLYLNHEMWNTVDQDDLKIEIEKIKSLTTRPIFNVPERE